LKEYIISITVSAITVTIADLLSPIEWKKYIRILLGFLILFVIISPLSKLKYFELPELDDVKNEGISNTYINVQEELKTNIEKDIETRLEDEFHLQTKATVFIDFNEDNKIKGVKRIELAEKIIPEKIKNRLKEVYGCEEIKSKFE